MNNAITHSLKSDPTAEEHDKNDVGENGGDVDDLSRRKICEVRHTQEIFSKVCRVIKSVHFILIVSQYLTFNDFIGIGTMTYISEAVLCKGEDCIQKPELLYLPEIKESLM
jgi:hypothetical protein